MRQILIILLFMTVEIFCQSENLTENKVIARAGDIKITAKEFRERFDFSPHPRTSHSLDTAVVKKEFLYTLIAEKLLAQNAKSLKLDSTKFIKDMLSYMGRLFIRDALYKKEISDKVKITPADIAEGEKRMNKMLVVKYLYSTGENEIKRLYSELQRGKPIDSLIIGRPEAEEQKTPGTVAYGVLDKNIEDSLYSLQIGQITTPIFTGTRWYIFKLENILSKPFFSTPDNLIKIKQIIKKRKAEKLEDDYLFNFLHSFQINVDRQLFAKLVNEIQKYLLTKKEDNQKSFYLVNKDFDNIKDSLGTDVLNSIFIKYKNNPETVDQFLTQLKYNGFKVDTTDLKTVERAFNSYVKNYLESELLSREGKRLHLDDIPSVKNDMKLWEDYYLSQQLMQIIEDSISISDADAYDFYSKNRNVMFPPEKIEVQEILIDSLETIQKALDELGRHIPFDVVSEKYSVVDSLRKRGGYLGYLPETQKGTIGEIKRIAKNMKVGEIYGPVKLSDGYALLNLVDVQNADVDKDTSFAQIKDELTGIIKNIEFDKKIKSYVADLALKYGIEINTDVYDSTPIFQFNTVTIRMIGFGGRIYAFPYKPLFAGWYDVYLKKKSGIPQ